MSIKSDEKGFTITELLVAIALSAMASVLIVTAFVYTYGNVLVEQAEASMVRQSQLFLRRMVEDIRLSNHIKTSNDIADAYNAGGWVTSDPANILVATLPATDENGEFVYDDTTGEPYYHEVVYFSDGDTMYRRLLANPLAIDSVQNSTCPAPNTGCQRDIELVDNVENMLFEFHDVNDDVTALPEDSRSVQVTINLRRQIYGNDVSTSNTTRITLRNED